MKRQWIRYIIVAFFACMLGALAHASISRAVQGNPDGGGRRARVAQEGEDRKQGEKPRNNLLRQLWDLVEEASDLSDEERSEAFNILEEADPILSRIKKENEQAIEILKNPPRRVMPKQPAKQDAETAPAERVFGH
ncbi:MAG: hypothetical protein U1E05_19720 [Patescibacteria group bacterium]|nr:hypothetical protein [Patescibacteria group bacterium]